MGDGAGSSHRPRKKFGQHFLHDRNIVEKIIRAIAPRPDDRFVEIGPGHGALTRPLLKRVASLDVVEIDLGLADELEADLQDSRFHVHRADALKFDFGHIAPAHGRLRVAGNLPYNISSPLLFHLLDTMALFEDMHVMLQKEVVTRMAAGPGNKDYGRLTVSLAARCRVEALFDIRPGSFRPPPRVDSTFVRLTPDPARRGQIDNEAAFDLIVRHAFGMRRKRLANALRKILTSVQIEEVGIDPGLRAEQIGVDDFIRLANRYARLL